MTSDNDHDEYYSMGDDNYDLDIDYSIPINKGERLRRFATSNSPTPDDDAEYEKSSSPRAITQSKSTSAIQKAVEKAIMEDLQAESKNVKLKRVKSYPPGVKKAMSKALKAVEEKTKRKNDTSNEGDDAAITTAIRVQEVPPQYSKKAKPEISHKSVRSTRTTANVEVCTSPAASLLPTAKSFPVPKSAKGSRRMLPTSLVSSFKPAAPVSPTEPTGASTAETVASKVAQASSTTSPPIVTAVPLKDAVRAVSPQSSKLAAGHGSPSPRREGRRKNSSQNSYFGSSLYTTELPSSSYCNSTMKQNSTLCDSYTHEMETCTTTKTSRPQEVSYMINPSFCVSTNTESTYDADETRAKTQSTTNSRSRRSRGRRFRNRNRHRRNHRLFQSFSSNTNTTDGDAPTVPDNGEYDLYTDEEEMNDGRSDDDDSYSYSNASYDKDDGNNCGENFSDGLFYVLRRPETQCAILLFVLLVLTATSFDTIMTMTRDDFTSWNPFSNNTQEGSDDVGNVPNMYITEFPTHAPISRDPTTYPPTMEGTDYATVNGT